MAEMTIAPVATHGFFLDGKWWEEGDLVEVRSPYDGALVGRVYRGRREHAEAAIAAAVKAFRSDFFSMGSGGKKATSSKCDHPTTALSSAGSIADAANMPKPPSPLLLRHSDLIFSRWEVVGRRRPRRSAITLRRRSRRPGLSRTPRTCRSRHRRCC